MTSKVRPEERGGTPPPSPQLNEARTSSLRRLFHDLSLPAKTGVGVLALGLLLVSFFAESLDWAASVELGLHLMVFVAAVVFASYSYRMGHDQTTVGNSREARIIRAAVPYTSRTLLVTLLITLCIPWAAATFRAYFDAEKELAEITAALDRGLERSDEALIIPAFESEQILGLRSLRVRGAKALWFKVFFQIEARLRPAPNSHHRILLPALYEEGKLGADGMILTPIAETLFGSTTLREHLAAIRANPTGRALGIALFTPLPWVSLFLFAIAFWALYRHASEKNRRQVLFVRLAQWLSTSPLKPSSPDSTKGLERFEARRAGPLRRLLTLQPSLCELISLENSSNRTWASAGVELAGEQGILLHLLPTSSTTNKTAPFFFIPVRLVENE
jgi:hypothetical protein